MKQEYKNFLDQYLTKEEKIARLKKQIGIAQQEAVDLQEALEELLTENEQELEGILGELEEYLEADKEEKND